MRQRNYEQSDSNNWGQTENIDHRKDSEFHKQDIYQFKKKT